MKARLLSSFLFAAVFLALTSTAAMATTKWYVNGVSGSDSNNCLSPTTACKTIGHAISLSASGDSIRVAAATYTENLTIGISLSITGSNAATTIIDGVGGARVVTISSATAHVALSRLTIRNGYLSNPFPKGAGIYNVGTLNISNSIVKGNTVSGQCYELCPVLGGGIYNHVGATLTITDSSITGNLAKSGCTQGDCAAEGGGIWNGGALTVDSSTLSGNTAHSLLRGLNDAFGGGIYNFGTVVVNNSTLNGNNAAEGGGGIANQGTVSINNCTFSGDGAATGGGISSAGTTTLQNSIVANSPSGGNCAGTMTSKGYNLSSDTTCNFNGPGDMNNINPMLGPLQNNGGPTQTMALPSASPAVDAGNPNGCTNSSGVLLKTDQRGKPRPDSEDTGGCDMGAYELQLQPPPTCIPYGEGCYGPGQLKCCAAPFPHHSFCSSSTGWGTCAMD